MNREALFCDGTQDYVIPAEPKENEKTRFGFARLTTMWKKSIF